MNETEIEKLKDLAVDGLDQPWAAAVSATWAGKTPAADELRDILEKHARWNSGQTCGKRADLRGAYLPGADLQGANLRGADLRGAYLQGADLQGANLRGADLRGAYLRGAYLQGANLRDADLQGANLRGADLRGAYLQGADLQGADLRDADLRGAYLQGANLRGADLRGAYLQDAKGELPIHRVQIVPDAGAFMAWKKLRDGVIAQLEIPATAGRVGGLLGRKCRAEKARVVALFKDGKSVPGPCFSLHSAAFVYTAGAVVEPDGGWDPSPLVECAPGIHFYITRREAEEHK